MDISSILLTIAKVSKLRVYTLYELMETVRIHLIITNNIIFCFHTDILCHFPQYLRDLRRLKRTLFYIFIYKYLSLNKISRITVRENVCIHINRYIEIVRTKIMHARFAILTSSWTTVYLCQLYAGPYN